MKIEKNSPSESPNLNFEQYVVVGSGGKPIGIFSYFQLSAKELWYSWWYSGTQQCPGLNLGLLYGNHVPQTIELFPVVWFYFFSLTI